MYKQHNSITTNRQKITYVSIPEDAARDGMKAAGMNDWFINSMTELYGIIIIRANYASGLSSVVEKITGKKPISFARFAREYAEAFKWHKCNLS
jgi:hypothetical protein